MREEKKGEKKKKKKREREIEPCKLGGIKPWALIPCQAVCIRRMERKRSLVKHT
jgi:hypothetical protein